jgi:hypothetical protein
MKINILLVAIVFSFSATGFAQEQKEQISEEDVKAISTGLTPSVDFHVFYEKFKNSDKNELIDLYINICTARGMCDSFSKNKTMTVNNITMTEYEACEKNFNKENCMYLMNLAINKKINKIQKDRIEALYVLLEYTNNTEAIKTKNLIKKSKKLETETIKEELKTIIQENAQYKKLSEIEQKELTSCFE